MRNDEVWRKYNNDRGKFNLEYDGAVWSRRKTDRSMHQCECGYVKMSVKNRGSKTGNKRGKEMCKARFCCMSDK